MPGLYFHIPFCRKACSYCDFHFSTSLQNKSRIVEAIVRELELRSVEMPPGPWSTLYFGGGTPSLLSEVELSSLLSAASAARPIQPGAEITLEANPDDLSEEVLAACAKTGINRLSIGIQSFRNEDLRFMNRAHDAKQGLESIHRARQMGFDRLTIDLIYAVPGMDKEAWRENLQKAIDLGIGHISAYALTIEPRTALAHQVANGKVRPVDPEMAALQMDMLIDSLEAAGYQHYEISNFALPGQQAKHNSSYWLGEPYLGVGPSAHSYDGEAMRSVNVANNSRYLRALEQGDPDIEREELSLRDRYHELILTRLRTDFGLPIRELEKLGMREHFLAGIAGLIEQGLVLHSNGLYRLSRAGKMLADQVAQALFVEE